MSRTPLQVQAELLAISPPGWTFPADPDTYYAGWLLAPATELSLIEQSMEAMLPQVDMRVAFDLLPDYQRVLGPDPCGRDLTALSFNDQAAIAYQQWTAGGDMCAGKLIAIAAALGVTATVDEAKGWICGASTCDDEMVPERANFMVIITLPTDSITNFECGAATCDDSLGTVEPSLAQCPITHAVPVHILPSFNYVSD